MHPPALQLFLEWTPALQTRLQAANVSLVSIELPEFEPAAVGTLIGTSAGVLDWLTYSQGSRRQAQGHAQLETQATDGPGPCQA